MNRLTNLRADMALKNAFDILISDCHYVPISQELKVTTAQAVKNRLDDKFIVMQLGNIVVTEMGFVTMALLTGNAIYRKNLLIIPGVDEKNQFGYLVLRNDFLPYHSLAQDIDGAVTETTIAHERAAALIKYYGDRQSLKRTAQAAPWYQLSTMNDAVEAGMCQWGTISFLKRAKIWFIARHIGLPRFLVRLSGGYGNRITASTTRRIAQKLDAKKPTISKEKTPKRDLA